MRTAVAALPKDKRNPGTLSERAKRVKAQARHRAHKRGRKTKPPSATAQRDAHPWGLFTTAPTVTQAVTDYAQRMSIDETFRDWHSGWGVRAAVRALPTEPRANRLIGVVSSAYSLQLHLGQRLSTAPVGLQRRRHWTVTDRVSWFWCGQRIFTDPGYDWRAWLAAQGGTLTRPAAQAVSVPKLALRAEAA